jgi:hypothetical protein
VDLAATIAAHLVTWAPEPAHVELASFGTDDPRAIAAAIDAACGAAFGSAFARVRFYQSSVGSVAGGELADGRAVVVKVHQPSVAVALLHELARVRALAPYAPRELAPPRAIGDRGAHATFEELVERGRIADAHDPEIRGALARGLHAIVLACRPLVATTILERGLAPPLEGLWPVPHSKLFDFAATSAGAEYIDEVARAARAVAPAGELVIAHGDWRAEHVRFAADGRIAIAYDWDSLRCDREPAVVGVTAHGFCANWSRDDLAQAPTIAEARAFIADYAVARGRRFDAAELRACGAAFAYACAYNARCGHALGRDDRRRPGTFGHLVATHGVELLEGGVS